MTQKQASSLSVTQQQKLWFDQYGKNLVKPVTLKPKFKLGDIVCISKVKGIFEKGYRPNWSSTPYKIVRIAYTNPIT